jgi:hypothetical protein
VLWPWILLYLPSCAGPAGCDVMCARAADAAEACLDERELGWSALGFEDRERFLAGCDTWAWEELQLSGRAATAATCAARDDGLDGSCASFEALSW